MGLFAKDLFHTTTNFFEFDAFFGTDYIQINYVQYKYNQLVVDFLNYDFTDFKKCFTENSEASTKEQFDKKRKAVLDLPLYRDFDYEDPNDFDQLFSEEEIFELSQEKWNENDFQEIYNAVELIEKYRWFLDEVNVKKEKDFIRQIAMNGMGAFVSDKTLNTTGKKETTTSGLQYVLLENDDHDFGIYEKITFSSLIDFFYTDFYKGIMRESIPKKCKLCGTYFLQEKGFHYEYCNNIFEGDKTCREVGSSKRFKEKTHTNVVWQIHQRAYKKYYARIAKKKITKEEFKVWAESAEQIRDAYLKMYEERLADGREFDLEEYTQKINSVK